MIVDEVQHRGFWNSTIEAFTAENPDIDVAVEIYRSRVCSEQESGTRSLSDLGEETALVLHLGMLTRPGAADRKIRCTIAAMTSYPYGMFTPAGYQGIIRRDADELIAALATADPAAPVPACPDWTVRDLVDHLGQIHQWARLNACSGLDSISPKHPTTGAADGEELASWYAGCVDELLKALATTDPAEPCWTFQPGNKVARFWSRRQSHETAMHRNDLQAATGQDYRYEAAHAVDGIGEVLDVFLKRRKVYGVLPLDVPLPLLIECTDRPERWLVAPVPGKPDDHEAAGPELPDSAAGAAAALRGPAAGLLLAMWKRQDVAAAGLTIDGDAGLAERFLAATLTP